MKSFLLVGQGVLLLLPMMSASLFGSAATPLQDPRPGEIIAEILIHGAGEREAQIRAALTLQEGQVFQSARYRHDVDFLWSRLRVRMEKVTVEMVTPGHVTLHLYVVPLESFRRVVFMGNTVSDLRRDDLLLITGLAGSQAVDQQAIPRIVGMIEEAYRKKGYAHVSVDAETRIETEEVVFWIQEGDKVTISSVQFQGNDSIPAGWLMQPGVDLLEEMELGDGWAFFKGSPYDPAVIQRDVVSLTKLYRAMGFLDAKVSLETPQIEVGDETVSLNFIIEEGVLYRVGRIEFENWDSALPLQYALQELEGVIHLKRGDPLEKARLLADEGAIRRFYGTRGHTVSIYGSSERNASFFAMETRSQLDAPGLMLVTYRIREGSPKRIREVIIEGNTQSQDRVIRREIDLGPGDLADMGLAEIGKRRLLGTNWFLDPETRAPSVSYRFEPTDDPDWVNLYFQVKEGRGTGNVLFGGGFSSRNGAFLSMTLRKANFDWKDFPSAWDKSFTEVMNGEAFTGAGQNLSLFLAPGYRYSNYNFSFHEPDLLVEHIDRLGLRTSAYNHTRRFTTHNEERRGLKFTLSRRFGRHFSFFAGPGFEKMNLGLERDVSEGSSLHEAVFGQRKHYAFLGTSWNTVVDPFSPVNSHMVRLEVSKAGGPFGGEMDIIQGNLKFGKYNRIWEDNLNRAWTLSVEGQVRHSWLPNGETIPFSEIYWLGGQGSIRGFDYRGIGEVDGFPVGGQSSWNSSFELRFPILSGKQKERVEEFQWARGAFFVDAGSFGDSFGDLQSTRISVGFGIRMRIPFMPQMPLALDFGWPIQQEPGDDTQIFSLTFGEF